MMEKKMETTIMGYIGFNIRYMGGCQKYGPILGTLHIRCCSIIEIQKGIIIFDNHPIVLPSPLAQSIQGLKPRTARSLG